MPTPAAVQVWLGRILWLKGGLGVVLDDAVAGVFANLILQVGLRMIGR